MALSLDRSVRAARRRRPALGRGDRDGDRRPHRARRGDGRRPARAGRGRARGAGADRGRAGSRPRQPALAGRGEGRERLRAADRRPQGDGRGHADPRASPASPTSSGPARRSSRTSRRTRPGGCSAARTRHRTPRPSHEQGRIDLRPMRVAPVRRLDVPGRRVHVLERPGAGDRGGRGHRRRRRCASSCGPRPSRRPSATGSRCSPRIAPRSTATSRRVERADRAALRPQAQRGDADHDRPDGPQARRGWPSTIAPGPTVEAWLAGSPTGAAPGTYPVGLGVVFASLGLPETDAFAVHQYGVAAMMVGAAMRLMRLHHLDAQSILFEVNAAVADDYDRVRDGVAARHGRVRAADRHPGRDARDGPRTHVHELSTEAHR